MDENNICLGYEGMGSFSVVNNNLTINNLKYWLNLKEVYEYNIKIEQGL